MKTITLNPSGVQFFANDSDSILDAALNSGITLSYSCKTGVCGACQVTLITGEVENQDPHKILSAQDISEGAILTCCSRVKSDCQIKAEYFPELASITQKVVPAKISEITFPTDDVAIVKLRLPPAADFRFLPGQYLKLNYAGLSRSYSIANNCMDNEGIELHIRQVLNGAMSEKVFSEFKENTLVRLDGPIGTYFNRPGVRPLIFLAGGTGFAPVKAMVEALLAANDQRPVHIYWGSQTGAGFYSTLPLNWSQQHNHINYVPVVSGDDNLWQGRRGFVHQAVIKDFTDLSGFDVYACGSPLMIEAARKDFIANGLSTSHFHSDAFVASTNE